MATTNNGSDAVSEALNSNMIPPANAVTSFRRSTWDRVSFSSFKRPQWLSATSPRLSFSQISLASFKTPQWVSISWTSAGDRIIKPTRGMKIVKKILYFFGTLVALASVYNLWIAQHTMDITVAANKQNDQVQNETLANDRWNMRNSHYQSCVSEIKLNRTSADCEEALQYGPPKLPFSYVPDASDGLIDAVRRRMARSICECNFQYIKIEQQETDLISGITYFTSTTLTSQVVYATADLKLPDSLPLLSAPVSSEYSLVLLVLGLAFFLGFRWHFQQRDYNKKPMEVPILSKTYQPLVEEVNHMALVTGRDPSSLPVIVELGGNLRRRAQTQVKRAVTLWEAAATNDMNTVQSHIASGAISINQVHKRYGTPLTAACEGGNLKIARLLLERGADVNTTGGRYHVPIQAAAYSGNNELVKLLLHRSALLSEHGGWKGTAIQAASEMGNTAMAKLLLDAGADANIGGGPMFTPLQGAAARGKVEVMKLLLSHGANVNEEGGEYGSALNAATSSGSIDAVDLLLQHKASVRSGQGLYGNCVQIAMRYGFPDLARLLVESGADGNVVDDLNRTPLIEAVRNGDEVLTRALLKSGVDVDKQDADGYTALHYVASTDQEDIAKMLVKEYGASVLKTDKFRAPPLHRAAGAGRTRMCKLFLDHGADVNAQDALGATALHQACGIQPQVVDLLFQYGADPDLATSMGETPLHSAIAGNNVKAIEAILARGCNANAQDNDQGTPLFRAIKRGHYHIAFRLLRHGVDVSVRSSSALQVAITNVRSIEQWPDEEVASRNQREREERADLVEALLQAGAEINAQGGQFGSALQAACTLVDHVPFTDILLDRGANPNLGGGQYGCALSAACYFGHSFLAKTLLSRGANPQQLGGRYGNPQRSVEMGLADADGKKTLLAMLAEASVKAESDWTSANRSLVVHDDDVWRLTPVGYEWLPNENLRDVNSAFGGQGKVE